MFSDEPVFPIPEVSEIHDTNLKMATVWTNQKEPCPALNPELVFDVTHDCIDETYDIEAWYSKIFKYKSVDAKSILQNCKLCPGRLYYELFWMYHLLVVPSKTAFVPKLRYGNVQRVVSQMRSGVTILVEINGEVMEEFMDMYNYTCAYTMDSHNTQY